MEVRNNNAVTDYFKTRFVFIRSLNNNTVIWKPILDNIPDGGVGTMAAFQGVNIMQGGLAFAKLTATNLGYKISRVGSSVYTPYVKCQYLFSCNFSGQLSNINLSALLPGENLDYSGDWQTTELEKTTLAAPSFECFPNPVGSDMTFAFDLQKTAPVSVSVTNAQGAFVLQVLSEIYPSGRHEIPFDASGLPSGVYFCTYQSGDNRETIKLIKY